jgi:hypothetical protein
MASGYEQIGMAGVGLSFGASIGGAIGQIMAARYNQKIAEFNREVANIQAMDALRRGRRAAKMHMTGVGQLVGSQRASLAAQGQDLSDGTAREILRQTAHFGAIDAQTIRNNAAREAWGYRVQGVGFRAQGDLATYEGILGATGTVLGGVGRAATGYATIKSISDQGE